MLQIISRKFYVDGMPVNEREQDAVLFSNFAWIEPIKTQVAELRPIQFASANVTTFIVRYKANYQPAPNDVLVLTCGGEAVDQFRLLCSLWFESIFHEDRNLVEHLCRTSSRLSSSAEPVPRDFVRSFFDSKKRGDLRQIDEFRRFVDRVIGMPREKYRIYIASLRLFHDALEAISSSFDLAYSMFVYLLEALSKTGGVYVPTWEDYDQNVRHKLDRSLTAIDSTKAEEIRLTLLEGAQLKLTKRFIEFVSEHIDSKFFTDEATSLDRAVAKADLEQVLRNLYQTRSGFVHELKKVHDQMSMPNAGSSSDLFTWKNQPYFSMAGLVHLTHHVLLQFASRQEFVAKEDYPNWRSELPGIVQVEVAPRYWIWQATQFTSKNAKHRFSGFMEHVIGDLADGSIEIPDMRDVLREIEKQFGQAAKADQTAMLALYYVVHNVIPVQSHLPTYEAFLRKHDSLADSCGIEFLATFVFLDLPPPWSLEDCQLVLKSYHRTKFRRGAVNLPRRLEIAIGCTIANLQLHQNQPAAFQESVSELILDGAGLPEVQSILTACRDEKRVVEMRRIVGWPEKQDGFGTHGWDWI